MAAEKPKGDETDEETPEQPASPGVPGEVKPPNEERPSGVGSDTDTGQVLGTQA